MKKLFAIVLTLLLVFSLAACGGQENQAVAQVGPARTITDYLGREVTVPETVERIACVGVGALRYTCYMGAADLVAAVEDYEAKDSGMVRLYQYVNFEKFKDLPVIGTNGEPFAEELIAVNPQVIVMSTSASVTAEDLAAKTGIPVVVIPGSDTTLDDKAYETIRILGQLFSKEDRAESLTAYLKSIGEDLESRTAGITEKPSVYVCGVSFKGAHGFEGTEAGYGPFNLVNANNLADTTGQTGAFDIDTEQVLSWDPEIIFVDYNGMNLINEDYAKNPAFYESLTAVQSGRVYAQISFRHCATNLETALADAYYAGSVIYPEAFADVVLEDKVAEIFEMLLGANPYPDLKEAGYAFTNIQIGK